MGQALDAQDADGVASHARELKEAGYEAVGMYYFESSRVKTLLTRGVADTVSGAGLFILSIYENGTPTGVSYFGQGKGDADAHVAGARADEAGQPERTPIYFAVDYDADPGDLPAITDYFTEVKNALNALVPVYGVGVYGSGLVCQHLTELGLVTHTWLSQSIGFNGYDDWKPHADVVQGPETTVLGLDVDLDGTNGDAGGWQLK